MTRWLVAMAGGLGFLAVALGAFGAHGLQDKLEPKMLTTFEVGVRYHMYHALALLATAWLSSQLPGSRLPAAAGVSFLIGIVLFSGVLYVLALTGARWLGMVAPLGGTAFMVGWVLLALAGWKLRQG